MRRRLLTSLTGAVAALALVAIVTVPASAQDNGPPVSPTQDQYQPPAVPGEQGSGGGEGGGVGSDQAFIGVRALPVPGAAAGAGDELPYTGSDLRLLLLIAAALLAAGLLLSAAARARRRLPWRRAAADA